MARRLLLALAVGSLVSGGLWARGGGGCFEAGTLVSVPFASGAVPIESLKPGDRVFALDAHEQVVVSTVTQVDVLSVDADLTVKTDGAELHVTPDHPFYTGAGTFAPVGSLAVGALLYVWTGVGVEAQPIRSVTTVPGPVTVYNLHTEEPHTFLAGGLVVHNKGGGGHGGGFGGGSHVRFSGSGVGTGGYGSGAGEPVPPWVLVTTILALLGIAIWWKGRRDEAPLPVQESPLDQRVDVPRARQRDTSTRVKLKALAATDRAFNPEALEPRFRDTFLLLQQAWTARDYGPLEDRLTEKLWNQHRSQLEALKRNHEVNRLDGLVVEGLWFFQVDRREGRVPEVTVLFQALVKDHYLDDRDQRFLRGDSSPQSFQEFWVFRLAPDGWRLAAIEQVTAESKRWGPGHVDDPRKEAFSPLSGVPEPERRMATWAAVDPLWAPGPFKERVSQLATAVALVRESRDLGGLDPDDFGADLWDALVDEVSRWKAEGLTWEVRNFCVRSVRIVLARARTKDRAAEVLCRVATHAQTTLRRGETFLSTDPDLKITEETWTLTLLTGAWKLTERRPYP